MEPANKRPKINAWTEEDDLLILDIWDEYENELRTCKRNAEVYAQMAVCTGKFTAQEVHLKIRNLRERYKAENIRMSASKGAVSNWKHYSRVYKIIENKTYHNIHSSSYAVKNMKSDPLDEDEPLTVGMPDFSPIPSPSSLSSEQTTDGTSKKPRIKRTEWTEPDNAKLVLVWEKYAAALRKVKRNSHIYNKMARELKKFTSHEVHNKINNIIQKYRKEKKAVDATGQPSTWPQYYQVERIVTHPSFTNPHLSASISPLSQVEFEDELEVEETQEKKKNKYRTRNNWKHKDNLQLINIWEKYEPELRSSVRNSHIYEKISEEMNGKFSGKEVQTKIHNLIQYYRKEKRVVTPTWPYFHRLHNIIGDGQRVYANIQPRTQHSDMNEQDTNLTSSSFAEQSLSNSLEPCAPRENSSLAEKLLSNSLEPCAPVEDSSFVEQSQSNSLEPCAPIKVSSSPIPPETIPMSPCSSTLEHLVPETSLKAMSSSDSESLADFSQSKSRKSESLQEEILENMRMQTELMQKLHDQSDKQIQLMENLCHNFEKFIEKQTDSNKAFMDIFQKLLEK